MVVVGDTRFVIGYLDGIYKATTDHKPLPEKERIEKAGGVVRQVDGVWRINNSLSVSRTLGDCYLKNQGVTADPDYYQFKLANSLYICVGCDGLFDVISTE